MRKRIAIRIKVREDAQGRSVVVQGCCPGCGEWADLDTDQLLGQVSIMCVSPKGCTFHETEKIVGVEYE